MAVLLPDAHMACILPLLFLGPAWPLVVLVKAFATPGALAVDDLLHHLNACLPPGGHRNLLETALQARVWAVSSCCQLRVLAVSFRAHSESGLPRGP